MKQEISKFGRSVVVHELRIIKGAMYFYFREALVPRNQNNIVPLNTCTCMYLKHGNVHFKLIYNRRLISGRPNIGFNAAKFLFQRFNIMERSNNAKLCVFVRPEKKKRKSHTQL